MTLLLPRLRCRRVISADSNAGERHVVASDYSSYGSRVAPRPRRPCRRKPRPPPTACGPASAIQAAAASNPRSDPLSRAVTHLGWLAILPRDRPTRDRCSMACARLQAVLAMEVPTEQGRPAEDRARDSQVNSPHVARESELGRPAHPVRARAVGAHGFRGDRSQVSDSSSKATVPNVADVPR